jgi:hypothetical protein
VFEGLASRRGSIKDREKKRRSSISEESPIDLLTEETEAGTGGSKIVPDIGFDHELDNEIELVSQEAKVSPFPFLLDLVGSLIFSQFMVYSTVARIIHCISCSILWHFIRLETKSNPIIVS